MPQLPDQPQSKPVVTTRPPKAGMSLAEKRPDVAALWHPTLNGDVTPDKVGLLARASFFFQCECGNVFEEQPRILTRRSNPCMVCYVNKEKPIPVGIKISETPALMERWDPANPDVASITTLGTHTEFSWICSIGHPYSRRPQQELAAKGKCPVCSNKVALTGANDLASQRPDLLAEWDFEKNALDPSKIAYGHTKPVAWKCKLGHEWITSPSHRVLGNHNCGVCSNKFVSTGFNDLLTLHPDVAFYYDTSKNAKSSNSINPANQKESFWWTCDLGHNYERTAFAQVKWGPKCQVCHNKILLKGFNDLATANPKLAEEWDEEKNGIAASDFLYKHHNENFWWKCVAEGHSWETMFKNRCRSKQPTNCPVCSNQTFLPEHNSLSAKRPDIAAELDEPDITGWEIPFGSPKSYNWKCAAGHKWNVSVAQRCHNNSGCMQCSKSNTSSIEARIRDLVIEGNLMQNVPKEDNERIMIPFGNRKYMRVDIVGTVQGKKCVIEYDSFHWHKEKYEIDNRKTNLLLNDGYIVIRIREKGLLTLEDVEQSDDYIELLDMHPNSHNGMANIISKVEEALKTIKA